MDIFKRMKDNIIVLAIIFGFSTVAIIKPYPGLFQLKGPMDTELTLDGRPKTCPAKNQSLRNKALQPIKTQKDP
jgi:hypothetical protein